MMGRQNSVLWTKDLCIGYPLGKNRSKIIAGPLNVDLCAGQVICLLGPNGCGKSTLIRTIAGLQDPLSGDVALGGDDLKELKPAQIAKKISLVLTDNVRSGNLDVYSLISLGRYPYSGWLGVLSQQDKEAIEYAINMTNISSFINRKVDTLSDGECQKVMLARALAQDTPLIILDEPTAHLDLPSRVQLMRLLNQLSRKTGKTILISTHELDLALQVADQIWLMSNDGHLAAGLPEELVLNGSFQQAFDKDGIEFDISTGTFPLHPLGNKPITVAGSGAVTFWTKKALVRSGFRISADAAVSLTISNENGRDHWTLRRGEKDIVYYSINELLNAIQDMIT